VRRLRLLYAEDSAGRPFLLCSVPSDCLTEPSSAEAAYLQGLRRVVSTPSAIAKVLRGSLPDAKAPMATVSGVAGRVAT
jgi:hypothetical protein